MSPDHTSRVSIDNPAYINRRRVSFTFSGVAERNSELGVGAARRLCAGRSHRQEAFEASKTKESLPRKRPGNGRSLSHDYERVPRLRSRDDREEERNAIRSSHPPVYPGPFCFKRSRPAIAEATGPGAEGDKTRNVERGNVDGRQARPDHRHPSPIPIILDSPDDDRWIDSLWAGRRIQRKDPRTTTHGCNEDRVASEGLTKTKGQAPKTTVEERVRVEPFEWLRHVPKKTPGDGALERARKRNLDRIARATDGDVKTLSKYLPSDIKKFFPFSVVGPEDTHSPPAEWLNAVEEVAGERCQVPTAPSFVRGISEDELAANTQTLRSCRWSLDELYVKNQGTTMDHGSEFRPLSQLKPIVGDHPMFEYLSKMFSRGFDYDLVRELTEEERLEEFDAQFERGNHQSATQNVEEVKGLLAGDVTRGFIIPILASELRNVIGVHLQPCGMVRQQSLQADGSRQLKGRLTHDLSFTLSAADASVNARVDLDRHPPMVYGWCFNRIVNYIVCTRFRKPLLRIYISKYDYSDAYKRISHSPRSAAATVIVIARIAYIYLRMAFGGSANPAAFSCFSEMLTDLGNELDFAKFDPGRFNLDTVLPIHEEVRNLVGDEVAFGKAILPAFEVDTSSGSQRDCFIDDIIDCHVDEEETMARSSHTVQLAVHLMSRPHAGENVEPVPRKPLLGPDKLAAEGRSAEIQIVLGWRINTRLLEVSLPDDKFKAWMEDLQDAIANKGLSRQELESLVGRLNHASHLIPLGRHFLNEIRNKFYSIPDRKRRASRIIRLHQEEVNDLVLWKEFLTRANKGISMNLITIRNPTRIAWSDSCPFGLGGYTLRGRAWRIKVPREAPFYGDDSVNNVLEFLGMGVSVLLMLQEARDESEDFPSLLALGDNTSAIAWLHRSGRVARNWRYYPAVKFIARTVARAVLDGKSQLSTQHIAGEKNVVADILSFAGDVRGKCSKETQDNPPNDELTHRIHLSLPQEIPSGFRIQDLPSETESFVLLAMQIISRSWRGKTNRRTRRETEYGEGGPSSSTGVVWEPTPSSIRYPESKKESSWRGASWSNTDWPVSTKKESLLRDVQSRWYRRLFATPLAVWHRRSGNVVGSAPSTSRETAMSQEEVSNHESEN